MRVLGLLSPCYEAMLRFFHSAAFCPTTLARLWTSAILGGDLVLRDSKGRAIFAGDGIKVPKAGRRMPAVKKHHQSASNTKPEYIMGHSCQAIALLVGSSSRPEAVPVIARIHEGVEMPGEEELTQMDRFATMLAEILPSSTPFVMLADAYYACSKVGLAILRHGGTLICRLKRNAVAYKEPPPRTPGKRGRPKAYGEKIKLRQLAELDNGWLEVVSPYPSDKGQTIKVRHEDLVWKGTGKLVRIVVTRDANGAIAFFLSTDTGLSAQEILRLYALRFRIEVTFKMALRAVGAWTYHFWSKLIPRRKRHGRAEPPARLPATEANATDRKLDAIHRHIQTGLIALGATQLLAMTRKDEVWASFGTWMRRENRKQAPSVFVTLYALRKALREFLLLSDPTDDFAKFLRQRTDAHQDYADAAGL